LQPAARGKNGESVVTLGAFVVASEREGQAKAIMERRASINAKNVVASTTTATSPWATSANS